MKMLNESNYSRISNIMRGYAPNIKTFAILTAWNPHGKETELTINKENNIKLEKRIRELNLGFYKISGKYISYEESFIVMNITKEETISLGFEFSQESVIWAEKEETQKDGKFYDGMTFYLLSTEDEDFGYIISKRNVFINVDNNKDFYSFVSGRKFQIPFFDDEYIDVKFKAGSGLIKKNKIDDKMLESLNKKVDKILVSKTANKSKWLNRGIIKNTILNFENFKQ
jgi:hypothetical protein